VSSIPSTRNVRIDPDALHRREVHDDAPLDNRVARDRVSSAAHRHLEVVLSAKFTAAMTSATPAQRAIRAGRRSIMPLNTARATS